MLKPGELLMQLHHFAYHQQGGHQGVFRRCSSCCNVPVIVC